MEKKETRYKLEAKSINGLCFDTKTKQIASYSPKDKIHVWNYETGDWLHSIDAQALYAEFSPTDGKNISSFLLSVEENQVEAILKITIWESALNKKIGFFELNELEFMRCKNSIFRFSADGTRVFALSGNGQIHVYDIKKREENH